MSWYLKVIRQYFDFEGRARRKEYWMFVLFNTIISLFITVIIGFIAKIINLPFLGFSALLYSLFTLIPSFAVSIRRAHDCDYRGWWMFVPVFNVCLLFFDGTPGANRFGADPKASEREHAS